MEKIPSHEKFTLDDISNLIIRLLSDDSLDEKGREEVITEFIRSHGYSPDLKAVSELSKISYHDITHEDFKNRLEKSVYEH